MTRASKADRAPLTVRVVAALVAVVFAVPVVYVVWRVVSLESDLGETFEESIAPMWRTIQLAVIVSLATGAIGTALAWTLVRTDVPFARLWRVLAPLPLVFPSFIGAAAFIAGLAPEGALRNVIEVFGYHPPERFRGLGASCVVLTAFTYPYVYLPVAARLAGLPPSIEESARLLGDGPGRTFARVVVPNIRSSVLGGMMLVALYSLSEFGAVQLLGYDTLTRVVYSTRLLDRAQSFAASFLLLVLAGIVIVIERRMRGPMRHGAQLAHRRPRSMPIGRWKLPAVAGVVLVLVISLIAPLVSLGVWAWRGISRSGSTLENLGTELQDLSAPAWSTASLGVTAALTAIVVVVPAAVLAGRYRSRVTSFAHGAMLAGFAAPGLVIALSLAYWSLNVPAFDRLYQTTPLLILAYVIHFGSQALRSSEVAVSAVPRRLGESAQLLGASPLRRALTVHLPLMRPGLLAGAGLVMLSTVKELPATLLLAPISVETLATRAWGAFEGGFLAEAGLASIVLVVVSGALTWSLVLRRADHLA